MFTINNPQEEDKPQLQEGLKYIVWQKERGEKEETVHYQGYIELSAPRRLTWIKNNIAWLARAHLEKRRGTALQAIDYCRYAFFYSTNI